VLFRALLFLVIASAHLASGAQISRIDVRPSALTLYAGRTWMFVATAYDAGGNPVSSAGVTWSSTDVDVLAIDTNGIAHAVADGAAQVKAAAQGVTGTAAVMVKTCEPALRSLFFLHHSVGDGLVKQGRMREWLKKENRSGRTTFELWDHGSNAEGLRDPAGRYSDLSYAIPDDNTDPKGLWRLWTGKDPAAVASRNLILNNHQVIAVKSSFDCAAIPDQATLNQYKQWYLAMRRFFDTRRDRVFLVLSIPPLHRLATNPAEAKNARLFAEWLKSDEYLGHRTNLFCYDLFDVLAAPDDESSTANTLKYEYETSHSSGDSLPNAGANRKVGPLLAQALTDAAARHPLESSVLAYCYQPIAGPDITKEIYSINDDGSDQRRVGDLPVSVNGPDWSPDARKIVMHGYPSETTNSIYVMDASGANFRRLTTVEGVMDYAPEWSPDGARIAFTRYLVAPTPHGEIWVMDADGRRQSWVGVEGYVPHWSPDGTRLIYSSDRSGNMDLFVCNADGTGERQVTSSGSGDRDGVWSPDGSQIAYVTDWNGHPEIHVMRWDGKKPRRLTNMSAEASSPDWSPDGSRIAFDTDVASGSGHYEVWVMDADGTGQTRVTATPSGATAILPDWRPVH